MRRGQRVLYSAAAAGGESERLRERLRSLAREAAGGEWGAGEWRASADVDCGFCSSELESVGEAGIRAVAWSTPSSR